MMGKNSSSPSQDTQLLVKVLLVVRLMTLLLMSKCEGVIDSSSSSGESTGPELMMTSITKLATAVCSLVWPIVFVRHLDSPSFQKIIPTMETS